MPKDPLAEALDATVTNGRGGNKPAIERHFGARPEVKESIIKARAERHLSYVEIATALNQEDGVEVSADAVGKWLKKQGVV